MAKKKLDQIDKLLDALTKDATAEEILKDGSILKELPKRFIERALEAEMTDHLGYEKNAPEGQNTGNSRKGQTSKTVIGPDGEIETDTPRDRNGSFEPQPIRKRQVRLDGLKGFPEAIESVFPKTEIQLCIVHMIRNSLRYVGWKERKAVAKYLKTIYQASTVEAAEQAMDAFEAKYGDRLPMVVKT